MTKQKITFLHTSDVHLGHQQFNLEERFHDFGRAFGQVVETALDRKVDFVIIGGDFFHKRAINAETLQQAMELLEQLKIAGIPVIAIEGNHDKAFYQDKTSWLNLLNSLGYLRLLKPAFHEGKVQLEAWNKGTGEGCITEVAGIKILGLGYLGATTNQRLLEIAEAIESKQVQELEADDEYKIMILHGGIGKLMGQDLGGIKPEVMDNFRGKIDYVALGHIHSRYEIDNWAFNPGALENCHIDEGKEGREKGFYYVEFAMGQEKAYTVEYIPSRPRTVRLISVDVTGALEPSQVNEKVWEVVKTLNLQALEGAMVQINLKGTIDFSTLNIDVRGLAAAIKEQEACLYVEVQNNINLPQQENTQPDEVFSRSKIEKDILEQLVIRNLPQYRDLSNDLVDLVVKVKDLALSGEEPSEVIGEVKKLIQELPPGMQNIGNIEAAVGSGQGNQEGNNQEDENQEDENQEVTRIEEHSQLEGGDGFEN